MRIVTLGTIILVALSVPAVAQTDWLYFDSDRSGLAQIHRSLPDGSNMEQLTFLPNGATRPYVVDGGRAVAFISRGALWFMNPDGSDPRQILPDFSISYRPSYSAVRNELVFSNSSCSAGFQILDLETLQVRPVQGSPISWSGMIEFGPDGESVIYVSCSCSWSPSCEVYSARLDGDSIVDIQRLTNDGRQQFFPDVASTGLILYGQSDNPAGYNEPRNLYTLDPAAAVTTQRTFFTGCGPSLAIGSFSEDGASIYYGVEEKCGSAASPFIRRVDLATGQDELILGGDGFDYRHPYQAVVFDPVGSIAGNVVADCPSAGTGLEGVAVDLYSDTSGSLVATTTSNALGEVAFDALDPGPYTITVVAPLGYAASPDEISVEVLSGDPTTVQFDLSCLEIAVDPRSQGFWKHQFAVAVKGQGHAHVSETELCDYLDLIEVHFNSNGLNPVVVYQPPASGLCANKVDTGYALLNLKGKKTMVDKARQQLIAVLLNVASDRLALHEPISADGATVSQAITFCDLTIDDPSGDHELAKDTAELLNHGLEVAAGVIPLDTSDIAYKQPTAEVLTELAAWNSPNPFNPSTTLTLVLPQEGPYRITVYALSGRTVRRWSGNGRSGQQALTWDGKDSFGRPVSSGSYLYRVEAAGQAVNGRMTLLK